ncbi:MAG: EamA family transporter [Solirubrobacteraceae bacterium]
MAAIAFALGCSVLWGLADFLGGLKSRTFPVPVVLGAMYLSSLTVLALFVGARGEGPPPIESVVAALSAGLVGIAGLMAFYRALAIGTRILSAPLPATGVALPVLVGIATGDQPGLVRSVGLGAAVVGIVLASREDDGGARDVRQQRQSVLLAIVAGVGFGSYFVLAEIASRGDVAWALVLSRLAALPFVAGFAVLALRRGGRRPAGRQLAALAALGVLDLAATAAYNHATTLGELSTVAVASSLYPVMTVLLAALVLGERVRGVQRVGILVSLGGVMMIAAGA